MARRFSRFAGALTLGLLACGPRTACTAELRDEIRVYTDQIADPGEFELEAHFNSVARRRPSAADARRPTSGLILTPELSYGLTASLEIEGGFLVPALRSAPGLDHRASPHLRLKWLPRRARDTGAGDWFWGMIFEWSASPQRPRDERASIDWRPVFGWRHRDWLLAGNLVLSWAVGAADGAGSPQLAPAFKVVRRLDDRFAAGLEYHGELGTLQRLAPRQEQRHTLYLTLDIARPLALHFGIGRGLNPQTGGWTVKGSLDLPLD